MVRVFCKNTGIFKDFKEGTNLLEMSREFGFGKPFEIVAAKVNNVAEGLMFRVFNNKDVEFLDYRSYIGRNVYCRSLCFMLYKAARDMFPGCKVIMRRPISKGYFCQVCKEDGTGLDNQDVNAISLRMKEISEANMPFKRHEVQVKEAIQIFRELGMNDKVKLLETCGEVYICYYTLGETADYYYDA
ncbi:MAG: nucleoside kinase, partial [Bacteroidales bacterium]|nr:nucleoside kinase [Bacteroidales bacterium]